MKLAGLIYIFPLLLSVNCQRAPINPRGCSYITKRYDFELVDENVRETYFNTFREWALMTGPGSLHKFVEVHDLNERTSHSVPCFLVWHRKFLKDAEDALRRINPNFVFLYWDWSKNHQEPHLAKVWDARYLGTNGKGVDRIVRDGVMNNITCLWPKTRPHLLKREFSNGEKLPPFRSSSEIQAGLGKSRNFYDAWKAIEIGFHPTPHDSIGGINSNFDRFKTYGDAATMYSPNDPFFWMHHAFIDMLWYSWQKKNGKEKDYYGYKTEYMRPWNVRATDYLDSEADPICATYDRNFLNQDMLPNPNPQKTLSSFAKSNDPVFRSINLIPKLTNILQNMIESVYNYTSTQTKNYIIIGQLIKAGHIPHFRVKSDAKDIPHPDIILETPPISDHFIEMNHMNVTEVREHEAESKIAAQAINSQLALNNPKVLRWFEKIWDEDNEMAL
jgi:hypothetical protein